MGWFKRSQWSVTQQRRHTRFAEQWQQLWQQSDQLQQRSSTKAGDHNGQCRTQLLRRKQNVNSASARDSS